MEMTKRAVKKALEIETDAELGRFFKISRRGPNLWGDDDPIPPLRQLQLHVMRPDLFGPAPVAGEKKAA